MASLCRGTHSKRTGACTGRGKEATNTRVPVSWYIGTLVEWTVYSRTCVHQKPFLPSVYRSIPFFSITVRNSLAGFTRSFCFRERYRWKVLITKDLQLQVQ